MKKLLAVFFGLFLTSAVFAQSADEITKILDSEKVTYGQVCYIVAVQEGLVTDDATETDAMNACFEKNQLKGKSEPAAAINYAYAAYYFAKMWNIKGSLLYRISKGSARYAFRQMKKDGVIPADADPSANLSGTELLNMFTMGNSKYVHELEAAE